MREISKSVPKKDHESKASGSAIYVADFDASGMLYGKLVRSPHARAKVLGIELPDMPAGYFAVDHRDVPGVNRVHIVMDDTPVFAAETVEYVGDPVLMLVGPEEAEVERLTGLVAVTYEPLPAILDVREADTAFFDYHFGRGDVPQAFAQADQVFEEQFETGYQEQAYLETQGMIAEYQDHKLTLHGSLQCPYYVHGALVKALGLTPDKVRVMQDVTGGGFGGKEAYPLHIGLSGGGRGLQGGRKARAGDLRTPGGYGVHLQTSPVPVHVPGRREGWPRHRHGH